MPALDSLTRLRALILNNNNLSGLELLPVAPTLQTLVLSHNPALDGPALRAVAVCSALQKLSLAHLPLLDRLPSLAALTQLRELRLNDCALSALPPLPSSLRLLDIGNNSKIKRLSAIDSALQPLSALKDLNAVGTHLATATADWRTLMEAMLPALMLLDRRPTERNKKVRSVCCFRS